MAKRLRGEFDVIVVGTGPGGATAARDLTLKGKKVLMLEWGGGRTINGTLSQGLDMVGIPGKSLLFTPQGLAIARGVTVGGSSILYCSTAWEPPHDMLRSYGVDIRQDIAEARKELPIAPLSDDLIGPQTQRIMESAQSLGYAWEKIEKYIHQDKCRTDCDKCFLGCPHGAKWNARFFAEEALKNGARLITRARARKVLVENGQASGVLFTQNGKEYTAHAPIVISAGGGIGTPILLRNSGIKEAGYDFFFDPLVVVFGSIKHFNGTGEVPMTTGVHLPDEGYMMTDMTMHHAMFQAFSAQAMRLDRLFAAKNSLAIMIKAKDALGGRLTDRGGVRKKLAQPELGALESGYKRAGKILRNAGAKNIYKTRYIAAHPGGTAKVGEIVDDSLQTTIKNLYVCDCSVIPEAWGLPPTLTLIGLGKRLARQLAGNVRDSSGQKAA